MEIEKFNEAEIRSINNKIKIIDSERFEEYNKTSRNILKKDLENKQIILDDEQLDSGIKIFNTFFQTRKQSGGLSWEKLLCDELDKQGIKYLREVVKRKIDILIPPIDFWKPTAQFLCRDCRKKHGYPTTFTKNILPVSIKLDWLDNEACGKCKVNKKWKKKFNSEFNNISYLCTAISAKRKVRERWSEVLVERNSIPNIPWYFFTSDDKLSKETLFELHKFDVTVVSYPEIIDNYCKKVPNSAIDIGTFIKNIYRTIGI